jgi:hypothetical protein
MKGKIKYMEINKYINIDKKKRRTKMGHLYLPRCAHPGRIDKQLFLYPWRSMGPGHVETSLSTNV